MAHGEPKHTRQVPAKEDNMLPIYLAALSIGALVIGTCRVALGWAVQ